MKPILFNTQMVKAILDNKKIYTRRIIKLPKYIEKQKNGLYTLNAEGSVYVDKEFKDVVEYIKQPYKIGDILYVKETWFKGDLLNDSEEIEEQGIIIYRADGIKNDNWDYSAIKWRPSIHMPKELARIFLSVKSIKVEKLQDIDEGQAKKEGAKKQSWCQPFGTKIEDEQKYVGSLVNHKINYKTGFADIWDMTIKEDKYSWEANPWVWVIEFEKVIGDIDNEK